MKANMKRTHRGEGEMKLVTSLAIVAATFYLGYKFIPVKVEDSKITDCIAESAKLAGAGGRQTADQLRDQMWECFDQIDAMDHFDKKDIKINKTSNRIRVDLEYEREVKIPGYTYNWKFVHHEDRAIF